MTKEEFTKLTQEVTKLTQEATNHTINVDDLKNKEDRTLVYGFTLSRNTFHLYLKNARFYFVEYDHDQSIIARIRSSDTLETWQCIPNNRAYPDKCDYEFCQLVRSRGGEFSFTIFFFSHYFNDNTKKEKYYGMTYDDFDKDDCLFA